MLKQTYCALCPINNGCLILSLRQRQKEALLRLFNLLAFSVSLKKSQKAILSFHCFLIKNFALYNARDGPFNF
jgi:hypothetical protein